MARQMRSGVAGIGRSVTPRGASAGVRATVAWLTVVSSTRKSSSSRATRTVARSSSSNWDQATNRRSPSVSRAGSHAPADPEVSATGNELGGQWLQSILGDGLRVHFLKDVYYGSHIDSTFVALRPGLVLCNPARVDDDTLPEILKQWDVIYSPPMENTDRYDAEYLTKSIGSNWIDMNAFSIRPDLVVVDRDQSALIRLIESHGVDVIPLKLRHSKMLGGGFHCVTLDIRRAGTLERYFD